VAAFWNDLRYAARTWTRAPAFVLLAIATIAGGTGALHRVLTRQRRAPGALPSPDGERVVALVNSLSGNTVRLPYVSPTWVRVARAGSRHPGAGGLRL
jgi:hypothetical protein